MSDTLVTRRLGSARSVRVMKAWSLLIVSGSAAGRAATIDKPIFRIGSHASNDLVIDDPTISKHHLELTVTTSGYHVADLGSSNGTQAGALRLGEITVEGPVELQLGETTMRLMPSAIEVEIPASSEDAFDTVLGTSAVMRELFAYLEQVAASDCCVILEGATGTGKTHIAESIHRRSARAAGPCIVIDCAALTGSLLEAELFGHVRGAFTGADEARDGLLALADGGTVVFEEIGELPLSLQSKLLGVLQRREYQPLGANRTRSTDLRVIVTTQRDLARMVNERTFRADLFYRLSVVRLRIPALRDRVEDIPLLVDAFLQKIAAQEARTVPPTLVAAAMSELMAQAWPGNVRELRRTIEGLVLQLPRAEQERTPAPTMALSTARLRARTSFELAYFAEIIEHTGHNLAAIAQASRLDRRYLARILRRLGLYPFAKGVSVGPAR